MFPNWVRALLFAPLLVVAVLDPGGARAAEAGCVCGVAGPPCGNGIGPCHCGDTVVTSTRLDGSDPVLRTPCPCDGLSVASNVTLHIGGTIRSETGNQCVGIVLAPSTIGVTVKGGTVRGFSVSVDAASQQSPGVRQSQFLGLQLVDSALGGLFLAGDENTISGNVIRGTLEALSAVGNANVVSLNRTEGNVVGLFVEGENNIVSRNVSRRNVDNGVEILGQANSVDRNQSTLNGRSGFVIDGLGHSLSLNIAERNASDGFTVLETAAASMFARNRSSYNGGFGILDGGANFYTDNRCTGNAAGPSDPTGLCF